MIEAQLTPAMRQIADLLECHTGQALSESRVWRLETSLKPVLKSHGLSGLDALVDAIAAEPDGQLAMKSVNALLNHETSFFRDAHLFQMLGRALLPSVMRKIEERGDSKAVRIWCAGCSTGQEVYSLAMIIKNEIQPSGDWRFSILATDVSSEAIARARSGFYAQMDVQRGLPINNLLRWFEPSDDGWIIHPDLRDMVDFRVDNLLEGRALGSGYDLILCRNVLLYFSPERKKQIFGILANHARVGGHLMLGAGETVIGHSSNFVASPEYRGTYVRVDNDASVARA